MFDRMTLEGCATVVLEKAEHAWLKLFETISDIEKAEIWTSL